MKIGFTLVLLIALSSESMATSLRTNQHQSGQPVLESGCTLTVYKDKGYSGDSWETTDAYKNQLSKVSFNDAISSLKVEDGCKVTFYFNEYYSGTSISYYGDIYYVGSSYNDKFSSYELGEDSSCYVNLYEDQYYGGETRSFTTDISDLRSYGWSDKVTSLALKSGCTVTFYTDINYGGTAYTYNANTDNVGKSANDQFSSLKFV
jgi:hypothetical protein